MDGCGKRQKVAAPMSGTYSLNNCCGRKWERLEVEDKREEERWKMLQRVCALEPCEWGLHACGC